MPAGKKKRGTDDRLLDILIVDDDPMIRLMLQGGIDAKRFSVSVTDSGHDAIAMCASHPFDFVILDYRMPGKSGLEVASALREAKTPFLMLSAFTEDSIAQRAAKYGALGYLVKPVTPKQVELAIDTAMARAEEIAHLARAAEVSGIVGVAVGIVMAAFGISRMSALDKLRAFCRPRNKTLKEVSLEVTNLMELQLPEGGRNKVGDALKDYFQGQE